MFEFKKPIVFFDTETTGVDVVKDKIVQLAVIKIYPDGTEEEKTVLFNPEIPIPEEATKVHRITDDDIANEPIFSKKAKGIAQFFSGCDIAGYNSDKFDIPILSEEMNRCGIQFPEEGTLTLDCYSIEKVINSHKLSETYKRYIGKDLEGAHDASADTRATVDVFMAQVEKIKEINKSDELDLQEIKELYQGDKILADFAGKFYFKDGELYFNFGKHQDKMVVEERGYVNWMLNNDFPTQTKLILNNYLNSLD